MFTRFAAFAALAVTGFIAAFALALGTEATAVAAAPLATVTTVAGAFAIVLLALALKLARSLLFAFGADFGFFRAFAFSARLVVAFVLSALVKVLLRLLHRRCRLHRADQAKIVVGVLQIGLAQHPVA